MFPLVIYYSKDITTGIIDGIKICTSTIIPSLYIFTVISVFAVKTQLFSRLKLIRIISNKLFNLSGSCGSVLFLSLICGYPVGAKLVDELYTSGELNKQSAERLLCFCINPGPAFVITTVGFCLYKNYSVGLILFISAVVSPIIFAFLNRKSFNSYEIKEQENINYITCFCDAVNSANRSIASVCGWVIIGNAVLKIFERYMALSKVSCFLEITSGVIRASDISIYLVAFLIGFGGISVHLQAISAARCVKPRYSLIFIWKIIEGISTLGITYLLLKAFPQSIQTININGIAVQNASATPFASFMLMLFLVTSLAFLQRKLKNYGKRQ